MGDYGDMTLQTLLETLSLKGIRLSAHYDKLKIDAKPGALSPDIVNAIKSHKSQLLELFRAISLDAPIMPAPVDEDVPVSPAQRRLWLVDKLQGHSKDYHIASRMEVSGGLDVVALRQTFFWLLRRHQSLRTCFYERDGHIFQRVMPADGFEVTILKGAGLPEPICREACAQVLDRPFDLAADYLLRVLVIEKHSEQYELVVNIHHIAFDGISEGILWQELIAAYEAYSQGGEPSLPPPVLQYRDYAYWRCSFEQQAIQKQHLEYWFQELDGAPRVHSIPLDAPRPPVPTGRAGQLTTYVDAHIVRRLVVLANQHTSTLFSVLLGMYAAHIARWSWQDDIVIGTPVSGREHRQLAQMIGFFVNSLALRFDLSQQPNLNQIVADASVKVREALAHQNADFDTIVESLKCPRTLAHHPLYQLSFSMNGMQRSDSLQSGTVQLRSLQQDTVYAKFDLSLETYEEQGGLRLNWTFNQDIFNSETILSLAQSFGEMLISWSATPECAFDMLNLLPASQQQALQLFNDTIAPYPREEGIDSLFRQQAALNPDKVAIEHGSLQVSYQALDTLVCRIATGLQKKQVFKGDRVAVALPRQIETVACLLAILRLGASYVPLSPDAPAARNNLILLNSQPKLVVTVTEQTCSEWGKYPSETMEHLASCEPSEPAALIVDVEAEQTAYIIYTSGSTGIPKGVAVPHRAVVRLVAQNQALGFGTFTRMLHASVPTFDAAVFEIWGPLLNGGTLVLLPTETLHIPSLSEVLDRHRVNTLFMTSVLFSAWVEQKREGSCGVEKLMTGGEVVSPKAVKQLYQTDDSIRIYNVYGPTENGVISTIFPIPRDWPVDKALPIGRPISQTQAYVMAAQGGLQPLGAPGELWLAGDGLASTYYQRDDLTHKVFIRKKGLDMYRSGDLVCMSSTLQIEYMGRIDKQVKLRGFRIELTEIELALERLSGVVTAIVLVKGEGERKQLVAYLVVPSGEELSNPQMISLLRNTLPDYMIPSNYIWLTALPTNANGKVDLAKLPASDCIVPIQEEYIPPGDKIESELQLMWQELFDKEQISVEGNFFELGGHSLLAMKMVSRIEQKFERQIPLEAVFQYQTIRSLALYITDLVPAHSEDTIRPVSRAQAQPLSYAQQRLWYIDQLEGGSANYHIPLSVKLHGELDRKRLQQSVDWLVDKHEILRTVYLNEAGQQVQKVGAKRQIPIQWVDVSDVASEEKSKAILDLTRYATQQRFDLQSDLMLRVTVIKTDTSQHQLLLVLHHIACDGWSVSILIEDLLDAYAQCAVVSPNVTAKRELQYLDFAVWQREWLQDEQFCQQLEYWQKQLEHLPVVHSLPLDKERPAVQSFRGEVHRHLFPVALSEAIEGIWQAQGITSFSLMYSAFSVLLSRYSKQDDIAVGTPNANRAQPETERMVGLFVNTVVLRSKIDLSEPFSVFLQETSETLLQAQANRHVPFEMIVETLKPQRALNHTPLFQILFTLQPADSMQGDFSKSGLVLEWEDSGYDQVKFDLAVTVVEKPGKETEVLWHYCADLFSVQTIERMANAYKALLQSIVSTPDTPIGHLSMVTGPEQKTLLQLAQRNRVSYSYPQSFPFMIEQYAQQKPDAVAVVHLSSQLSYKQLCDQSNQLAHHLLNIGARQGQVIALKLPRSIDMVVAMLAVMKVGCSYLPIAIDLPQEREQWILDDSDASICITTDMHAKKTCKGIKLLCLDQHAVQRVLNAQLTSPPEISVTASCIAYIIYTSGSTGRPKGVRIRHDNLLNLSFSLRDMLKGEGLQAGFRWAWNASYVFDASLQAVSQLAFGVELHVLEEQWRIDPDALNRYLSEQDIDVLDLTPAQVPFVLGYTCSGKRANLLIGGEAIHRNLWQQIGQYNQQHGTFAWNLYGPTECTVDATYAPISCDTEPSLGQQLPNVSLYVTDESGQLLPAGAVGELMIGGKAVGAGYINATLEQANRFVCDPFESSQQAYRTGDLVRWTTAGQLEYFARVDGQIKFRGYRIDLGEIESTMSRYADLEQCAAVLVGDPPEADQLVAYLKPLGGASGGNIIREIKQGLQASLPAYMVPSHFVVLDTFPFNSSGKLDRRQLRELPLNAQIAKAAETTIERRLLPVFQLLLKRESIDFKASFFEQGGHSLNAVTLVSRINKELRCSLPLQLLYRSTSLEDLCFWIEQQPAEGPLHDCIVPVNEVPGGQAQWVFVPPLSGIPGAYRHLIAQTSDTTSLYGLRYQPGIHSLEKMLTCFADAVEQTCSHDTVVLLGWSAGGVFAQALADELYRRNNKEVALVMLDAFPSAVLRNTISQLALSELRLTKIDDETQAWATEVPRLLSDFACACSPADYPYPSLLIQAANNVATQDFNGWNLQQMTCVAVNCDHAQILEPDQTIETLAIIKSWLNRYVYRSESE